MQYFPLALPFVLIFFLLGSILLVLIEIGVLEYAYARMGINRRYVFALLLLSLLGSYVNIPIAYLPAEGIYSAREITYFGIRHIVPQVLDLSHTVLAINLGGAVVPICLSLYLLAKNRLLMPALFGTLIVALIVHWMAEPVRGLGIAVPIFVPPIAAAFVAIVLSRRATPALAYICGSMGALIGADLWNLGLIQSLGVPVASIGGAGTFDGIFLTGIVAVLLA